MKLSADNPKKISVLLADDHQILLDLLAFILTSDGRFKICGKATNGKRAVEQSRALRPDVTVMDINMTPLDGFEAVKLIRQHSPASKIIVMSMHVLPAYAKKMKALGVMGYVTKSSAARELIIAIIEAHSNRQYFCREIQSLMDSEHELLPVKKNNPALLTTREIEIIQLLEKGLTSKEIACKLFLSPKTIHIHRHSILRKFNVKNTTSLVAATQALEL